MGNGIVIEETNIYKERILTLADIFTVGGNYVNNRVVKCDMDCFLSPCSTRACICGHAILQFGDSADKRVFYMNNIRCALRVGARLLGLDYEIACELFLQHTVKDHRVIAVVLRNLASTGKVSWPAPQ